jgi:hypothetical protein
MILKVFLPNILATAFFAQTTAIFCTNMIITLFFLEKLNFLAKIAKIAEN